MQIEGDGINVICLSQMDEKSPAITFIYILDSCKQMKSPKALAHLGMSNSMKER